MVFIDDTKQDCGETIKQFQIQEEKKNKDKVKHIESIMIKIRIFQTIPNFINDILFLMADAIYTVYLLNSHQIAICLVF